MSSAVLSPALERSRALRRVGPRTRELAPTAFVLVNAIAFYLLRPGVPDLWAARARAFAAGHGVGITYWFGWFGGSTPGNYSVVTPYLCSVLGTEAASGLAAVATCASATVLLRRSRRPTAAAFVAAFGIVVNLWCGRVAFLIGAAFAVAALVFVMRRRSAPAAALTVLSVLASPVSGAFLGLGLSGMLLARRVRPYRRTVLITIGSAAAVLVALALLFGAPGPEPFPLYLVGEILLVLALMMLARPSDHLRVTLAVSAAAVLVVFSFPNGLGANLARLALFCLPPVMVAQSRRGWRTLAALTLPILVLAGLTSVSAVVSASRPASSAGYYAPLAAELDRLPKPRNYRLEVVNAAHAANAVLLGHAVLARGWETQEDRARNAVLTRPTLDPRTYRGWLRDNAVGYLAVSVPGPRSAEERVIGAGAARGYWHQVWRSVHWRLYRVLHPTPIVAAPAVLEGSTQSAMTVRVPCACRTTLRIRWSKFLAVTPEVPTRTPDAVEDSYRPALVEDGGGWTALTTNEAGTYVLGGA